MKEQKNEQNGHNGKEETQQRGNATWIDDEAKALASVAERVKSALFKLDKKSSRKRIHDARTALKRWNAVWSVLATDGWAIQNDTLDELNKLFKKLGDVRDYDVYLKRAKDLNVPKDVVECWKSRRKKARKRLESQLKKVDMPQICKALDKMITHEPPTVVQNLPPSTDGKFADQHIGFILHQQEKRVYKAALAPAAPEDYHSVRKEVKNWEYLLEELTQEKNEQLKEVEQKLGDLHDLDKLVPLLLGDEANQSSVINLQLKREQLLSDLDNLTEQLPLRR